MQEAQNQELWDQLPVLTLNIINNNNKATKQNAKVSVYCPELSMSFLSYRMTVEVNELERPVLQALSQGRLQTSAVSMRGADAGRTRGCKHRLCGRLVRRQWRKRGVHRKC